jgi:uncharacterized protein (DUF305 family)
VTSPAPRSAGRTALIAIIALALVLTVGGLAVALGVGRDDPTQSADSVDGGFARDMARHHLQAVEMADLVPDRSQDTEVRLLAYDISSTQNNQVGRMQGWLDLWDLPLSGGDTMAWMGDEHAGHVRYDPSNSDRGALMPGMATDQELANLRSLTGTAFDVEFLRLMIRHHQGGAEMAEYAADHAAIPQVRDFAGGIARSQETETVAMIDMLTARGGTPLPAP